MLLQKAGGEPPPNGTLSAKVPPRQCHMPRSSDTVLYNVIRIPLILQTVPFLAKLRFSDDDVKTNSPGWPCWPGPCGSAGTRYSPTLTAVIALRVIASWAAARIS